MYIYIYIHITHKYHSTSMHFICHIISQLMRYKKKILYFLGEENVGAPRGGKKMKLATFDDEYSGHIGGYEDIYIVKKIKKMNLHRLTTNKGDPLEGMRT